MTQFFATTRSPLHFGVCESISRFHYLPIAEKQVVCDQASETKNASIVPQKMLD